MLRRYPAAGLGSYELSWLGGAGPGPNTPPYTAPGHRSGLELQGWGGSRAQGAWDRDGTRSKHGGRAGKGR